MSDNYLITETDRLAEFLKGVEGVIRSYESRLMPQVLAHFNDWASSSIDPLLSSREIARSPSTHANYTSERRGFLIHLGNLIEDGKILQDFWDKEVHDRIERYVAETRWVWNVETGFYIPK